MAVRTRTRITTDITRATYPGMTTTMTGTRTPLPPSPGGGLVAIGLAGGLLPSPSALIVFLGALGLGHAWFGVALVVAFGLGMAATLAAVGLVVMRLRERAEARLVSRPQSRFAPLLRIAPLVTAAAVVGLGAVLALRGLAGTGVV